MQTVKQSDTSAAHTAIPYTSVLASDMQSRISTVLTVAAWVVRPDLTSQAGVGTSSQPDQVNAPGVRRYVPDAADISAVMPQFIRLSATSMETREIPIVVVPYDPFVGPGSVGSTQYQAIQNREPLAVRRSIPFVAVSAASPQTRIDTSLLTLTVQIIKSDGTSVAGAGTVIQPDPTNALGCCFYVTGAADLDTNGESVAVIYDTGGTMEPREIPFTVVPYDPYVQPWDRSTTANASTDDAIRDRILTLIEALTPTSLAGDKFRRYRNEGDGDFHAFAQDNPQLRRFQARDTGEDAPPAVSNMITEERELHLDITISYPQTARTGRNNALDRDDVMIEDWKKIDFAIGICGGGNFSGTNNCTPLGCTKSVERVGKVDFLVIRAQYRYWRSTT